MPRWAPQEAYKAAVAEIVAAREAAGLTQRDVAKGLKVPHSVVAKIEMGERRLDAVEVIVLARLFGVEPQDLLGKMVTAVDSATKGGILRI